MTLMNRTAAVCALLWVAAPGFTQARWKVDSDGEITWEVTPRDAHQDQIEMSGRKISAIITYGVRENGTLTLTRQVVFPSLRTIPNDTHASLSYTFGEDATPRVFIGGRPAREVVGRIHHRGLITVDSIMGSVALTRTLFPSIDKPVYVEKYSFTNRGTRDVTIEVESTENTVRTSEARGVTGEYIISSHVPDAGVRIVKPGEGVNFVVVFTAREAQAPPLNVQVESEEKARRERIDGFLSKLRLETPDAVLNTAFAFAKIRATESIYETKGGLMHGPGGGAYYAAIWANDQA
jgi:hypothetical protein